MIDETQKNQIVEIDVLKPQDLTNSIIKVKRYELPKYWDKNFINEKVDLINNYQHKMLIKFLWYSGVRITEAISLTKENIDFTNYTLTLRWLKSRKYKTRIAPMHPELKSMLEIYTATKKAEDLIFPISRQRAWQLTIKYLGGNPHMIRHSYAVNWLRSGGDIVILHRILGHAKIQTTMEYLKIVPNDLGKELIKISFR